MIVVYGIRNCDTVKRARAALDAAGIAYRFHDFKTEGLSEAQAQGWIDQLGADTVINRRGTTWRQLDAATQARAEREPAAVLAANTSLVKRPVFEAGSEYRVGFAAAEEAGILDWLRRA